MQPASRLLGDVLRSMVCISQSKHKSGNDMHNVIIWRRVIFKETESASDSHASTPRAENACAHAQTIVEPCTTLGSGLAARYTLHALFTK